MSCCLGMLRLVKAFEMPKTASETANVHHFVTPGLQPRNCHRGGFRIKGRGDARPPCPHMRGAPGRRRVAHGARTPSCPAPPPPPHPPFSFHSGALFDGARREGQAEVFVHGRSSEGSGADRSQDRVPYVLSTRPPKARLWSFSLFLRQVRGRLARNRRWLGHHHRPPRPPVGGFETGAPRGPQLAAAVFSLRVSGSRRLGSPDFLPSQSLAVLVRNRVRY